MKLYQITLYGSEYIQSDEIYNIGQATPIIGAAEFILEVFKSSTYEIDGVQYPADQLDTATKIQCLIDDQFIEELGEIS